MPDATPSAPAFVDAGPPDAVDASPRDRRTSKLLIALGVVALGGAGFIGYSLAGGSGETESAEQSLEREAARPAPVVDTPDSSSPDLIESVDGASPADESIVVEESEQVVVSNDDSAGEITPPAAAPAGEIDPEAAPTQAENEVLAPAESELPAEVPIVAEEATVADDPTPAAATEVADADTDASVPPVAADEVAESRGVVRNGQIYLEGAVPTAEAGAEIEALAAEVLGSDNVFNNYVVDPRAGDPSLGNLTVEDTINFPTNSSLILTESEGLLNQGLALLTIRPNMTIQVVGHTDARGSDDQNQTLSEQRADAVKQWFVDRGVDGDRISTRGAGETEPIAENDTSEGQRLNRRIQFFIENLVG